MLDPQPPIPGNQFIDLSHHQSDSEFSFNDLRNTNVTGIALKTTQGTNFTDPTYVERIARARTIEWPDGIVHYHFFDPSKDPGEQATYFAECIKASGGLKPGETVAFDLESQSDPNAWNGVGVNAVLPFGASVKGQLVIRDADCEIYGSLGWLKGQFGLDLVRLTPWALWVARYAPELGSVSPWPTWKRWQYCETGGISGGFDLNVCNPGWAA